MSARRLISLIQQEAERVTDSRESAGLLKAVCIGRAMLSEGEEQYAEQRESLIETARQQFCGDPSDIDIDEDAELSACDDGCWVGAWVWVPNE